jgi:hypothetical protein
MRISDIGKNLAGNAGGSDGNVIDKICIDFMNLAKENKLAEGHSLSYRDIFHNWQTTANPREIELMEKAVEKLVTVDEYFSFDKGIRDNWRLILTEKGYKKLY